jgi:hypothetical protein
VALNSKAQAWLRKQHQQDTAAAGEAQVSHSQQHVSQQEQLQRRLKQEQLATTDEAVTATVADGTGSFVVANWSIPEPQQLSNDDFVVAYPSGMFRLKVG